MIKSIHIDQYRKLQDVDFNFSNDINVISGTNGTCKTSLLHIISNSFQSVVNSPKCPWVTDKNCLICIKAINNSFNPKIETLTRGDKQFNDPAPGFKGTLYTTTYVDDSHLDFRKHISKTHSRYAIKPLYKNGSKENLPFMPIIYLGLSRLFPYGEYGNDEMIEYVKKSLPTKFQKEVNDIYKDFTGINITESSPQKMGDIKTRSDFSTEHDGIDSNTISAGEDNLYIIITAIVSLKYYYESISSTKEIESILLIDELDATLHPSFQIKLLNLFKKFADKYKIQFFFTTHSLSLLEEALKVKYNVIYLYDHINSVTLMEDTDIYKIKMHLFKKTKKQLFMENKIPIFTEDEEARLFLSVLFDYFSEQYKPAFNNVRHYFHFVKANFGADNLTDIFTDSQIIRSTIRSICILDGDKHLPKGKTSHIISLPGKDSPEKFIMEYGILLLTEDNEFFRDSTLLNLGFSITYFRDEILNDYNNIDAKIESQKSHNCSTKGMRRTLIKEFFNDYQEFFICLFKYWIHDSRNQSEVDNFYNDLRIMFKKVSEFHNINSKDWE